MTSTNIKRFICIYFCFCTSYCVLNCQVLSLSKTVSSTNVDVGDAFSYIINASCNSSSRDCESVVLTDVLDADLEFINFSSPLPDGIGSATYDASTRTATITFDASSCTSCTPDGINTDNDDFAQGSTVQLEIQVRFRGGTFTGTTVNNTINGTSNNAGNPSANAPVVTAANGQTAKIGCNQMNFYTNMDDDPLAGGSIWHRSEIANFGTQDITNFTSTVIIPSELTFTEVRLPYWPNNNHVVSVYYERSDSPGTFVLWNTYNVNAEERWYASSLGLPAGVTITSLRTDFGTLSGDGSWMTLNSGTSDWNTDFRIYGNIDPSVPVGAAINVCTDYTGTVGGVNCDRQYCSSTIVSAGFPALDGYLAFYDALGEELTLFEPGGTYDAQVSFASDEANNTDVVGAVMSAILPVGITYAPGSWSYLWGQANVLALTPEIQTYYLADGRQVLRFVYDTSFGNSFTIVPDGTWRGFAIEFQVNVNNGAANGWYDAEYYFTATGSDHGCDVLTTTDTDGYLGGYGFDLDACSNPYAVEILRAPGSAGLDSYKEVRGQLNAGYNRYPNFGTTVPGGISDYRFVLTNPNATPINNITIIDVFPYIGDTEVLNSGAPRSSQWRPKLLEPITAPAGTTVYYTSVNNPCRDELAGSSPTPFPAGCTAAGWTTTAPADITTVTGFKLELGATTLNQGDTYQLDWEMRAPVDAPISSEVAWNSFAYVGNNASSGTALLAAEPVKVGVESNPGSVPFLGDFVWRDINGNGQQDGGEPGQDGVTVILYRDNGDGIANTSTDTEIRRTVTANGGQYLFSDFLLGNYFVEFTNLPSGYNATHTNTGSDATDSDGLITTVRTYGSTSDDRSVDLGIYPGTPPALCDMRTTIDSEASCGVTNNNGGFEDPGTATFDTVYQGIPAAKFTSSGGGITDWLIATSGPGTSFLIDDSADQVNNPEGDNFFMLGTSGWCVANSVNLNAGECYDLDFWVAFYNSDIATTADINIEVRDSLGNYSLDDIYSQTIAASSDFNNMTWVNINFSYTPAKTEQVRFYFTLRNPTGPLDGGIAIDDFHIGSCCVDICLGETITLTTSTTTTACGGGSLDYLWSTGETTPTINVSPAVTTTYTVTVTDCNGCSNISMIDVNVEDCCTGNVLINREFESGFTSWTDWGNSSLTNDAFLNSQALLVSGGDGGRGQTIAVSPGQTYRLSFYAKKTGVEEVYGGINFKDSDNTTIYTLSRIVYDSEYDLHVVTATAPPGSVALEAYGWKNTGAGTAYFDGFCLELIDNICVAGSDLDGDGIVDHCDIDDDNDGLKDRHESGCPGGSEQGLLEWNHNTLPDRDAFVDYPTVVGVAGQENYGFGLGAYIENTLVKMTGVNQPSLAAAIADNDYLEYSFSTTPSFNAIYLKRFTWNKHGVASAAQPDNYGYDFSILVSDDGFTTSQTIADLVTVDNNINPSWYTESTEADDNFYYLQPARNYTFRIYFYNKTTDSNVEAWFDDFFIIGRTCGSSLDTDGDGYVNSEDLDSDNDGLYDAIEAGHGQPQTNGVLTSAMGTNGYANVLETNTDNGLINFIKSDSEATPDGTYDPYELDSDGDGCFDSTEENISDSDNNGTAGTGVPSVNGDGLVIGISYSYPINNTYQNPAVGNCLTEVCDDGLDNDFDGLIDCFDCDSCSSSSSCGDNDGDGISDFCDLDDDNDGIPDSAECPDETFGPELVINGDFENGYANWTSDFNRGRNNNGPTSGGCSIQGWVALSPCASINGVCNEYYTYPGSVPDGSIVITDNLGIGANLLSTTNCNSTNNTCLAQLQPDHTTGSGLSLYVDPNDIPGQTYWRQSVSVQANRTYEFSAWLMVQEEDPNLQFKINNVALTTGFNLDRQTGGTGGPDVWQRFFVRWNSNTVSGNVDIELVNLTAGCGGNDLRLDDVSLREVLTSCDCDGDGVINSFDLDSDNDGIYDLVEAGHNALDIDGDGVIDGAISNSGTNGLFNNLETALDNGILNYVVADSESGPDGIIDACEIDSDGDGCLDTEEEDIPDGNNDGIVGSSAPSVTLTGLVSGYTYVNPSNNIWQNPLMGPCLTEICNDGIDNDADGAADCYDCEDCWGEVTCSDNDSDGVGDFCDLDDDNDGIPDIDEGCNEDAIFFPYAEFGYLFQQNPSEVYLIDIASGASSLLRTLTVYYNAVAINEEDGLFWAIDVTNGNTLTTFDPTNFQVVNTFGSYNSVSSAYDPIRKIIVLQLQTGPTHNIVVIDANPISPSYGNQLYTFVSGVFIPDIVYNSDDGLIYGIGNWTNTLYRIDVANQTTTSLGAVPGLIANAYGANYATIDGRMFFSNNTTGDIYLIDLAVGISASVFSTGPSSGTNDGAKVLNVDLFQNQICLDTDNDGIPNSYDLDSDNDGIYDVIEAGHGLSHTNGELTLAVGSNGLVNTIETSTDSDILNYAFSDSESSPDGDYDAYELDSDEDGCYDSIESEINNLDPDDNGYAGTGSPTALTNGLVNGTTYATPVNNYWQDFLYNYCQVCRTAITNPHVMYYRKY